VVKVEIVEVEIVEVVVLEVVMVSVVSVTPVVTSSASSSSSLTRSSAATRSASIALSVSRSEARLIGRCSTQPPQSPLFRLRDNGVDVSGKHLRQKPKRFVGVNT